MHFNKCFEGVSGKRGIFHDGKLPIEPFPSRDLHSALPNGQGWMVLVLVCAVRIKTRPNCSLIASSPGPGRRPGARSAAARRL